MSTHNLDFEVMHNSMCPWLRPGLVCVISGVPVGDLEAKSYIILPFPCVSLIFPLLLQVLHDHIIFPMDAMNMDKTWPGTSAIMTYHTA